MEMKNNLLWAIKLLFIILFSGVACSQLNKRKPYSGLNEVPTINTESVKHFDRFWERKAIFKNQEIKFGKYRLTYGIERIINQNMSIINHVSVYENKNKYFTVDESAAIVLLEKSSNKLILTVPINSGLNKYSVLVQHYIFEDNLISLCDKSVTEQVLASLSEKDASSAEDAEWRRDHYRLQDYLRSVSWQ